MIRHTRSRSTLGDWLRIVRSLFWKLLLLAFLFVFVAVAIPAYSFGARLGAHVLPAVTDFFYKASGPVSPTPTPPPTFPTVLPQVGSLLYTLQEGESCDEVLAVQMNLVDAGEIFSDIKPNTIKALDTAIGQDCHALQPGMVLRLSPQYPLVALGGIVLKIDATSPQEVIPTPLIPVPTQDQTAADCSSGCALTVRVAQNATVRLVVTTTLPLHVGAWIWTQAMMARKSISDFATYPYVDPHASLNGMVLRACDFQVENTHDDNSTSCSELTPNTIDTDGGAWLFGVAGASGLGHWGYPLKLHPGTRVLVWLTEVNGNLKFKPGNPVYRYDEATHVYVHA
jgi:hypothetical protein